MNEIREVAKAYYMGATEENKELARESFRSLDKDGDGKISLEEYKEQVRSWYKDEQFFKKLDEDGDGTIDFNEFLALHYMEKVDVPKCDGPDGCKELLIGSYFSCLMCLGNGAQSFDLCCKCYEGGRFIHQHTSDKFIDNRAQLKLLYKLLSNAKISQKSVESLLRNKGERERAAEGLHAVTAAVEIGSSVADLAGCSIL